jgi:hypothetical protein
MKDLFSKAAEIELKNAYNITATNFMKNLIFYDKPLVAKSYSLDLRIMKV